MRTSSLLRKPGTLARSGSALTAFVIVSLVGALTAVAADSFNPAVVTLTLQAGQSADVKKTLHLDALPGAADIVFAVDTTGSMGTAIAQAKTDATNIVNQVQAQIPGARFALVDFKDYVHPVDLRTSPPTTYTCDPPFTPCNFGETGDYPYKLDLPLTGGPLAATAFSTAVSTLSASGGGDLPEAYNRAFFEAVNDPALVYVPNAVKFLIVLGDNIGHDPTQKASFSNCPNTLGPDPGRDGTIGEPAVNDDLPTLNVINGLAAANDKLLMISYGSFLSCYSQLVAPTGGTAVASGGSGTLPGIIVNAIKAAAAHINKVNLVVSAGCPIGISFSPAPPYGPFTAPVDINFTETITAPMLVGNYTCTVTANVDGTDRAVETINVTVTPGKPATLVLTPAAKTNTVGDTHCVTATVRDAFGNPTPGITVQFTVVGAVATFSTPSSGSSIANGAGQATFCFTAALPGVNGIHAFADTNNNGTQDVGEPFGDATKVWILPVGTALCEIKITDGGFITAINGDQGSFGGVARSDAAGNASGNEEYQDHGPAQPMNFKATNILAITCTPDFKTANVYGTATIDGSGSFAFRIRMTDNGDPGIGMDVYGIIVSNGYLSGDKVLQGGNIQIHKLP
jgi:hypothetical protein